MSEASKISEKSQRTGPRPLALHLGLATTSVARTLAALPLAGEDKADPLVNSLPTQSGLLVETLSKHASPDFISALSQQGSELVQEMIDGIHKYHLHPYQRLDRNRPVIWSDGSTSLLDCNPMASENAPVLFIIPSLINRSYVLDLMPGRSLVDHLSEQGIRPLLLDWGAPGNAEKEFTLNDYILGRICGAWDYVSDKYPDSLLHMAGYCMGGTLAVVAAERRQDRLTSFIALASPWDFHAELNSQTKMFIGHKELWATILEGFGELPVDLLQTLFASLDPNLGLRKFSMFAGMDMASERAIEFVALEDWLNDGTPLPKKVAEECFREWYGANTPHLSAWKIGGQIVCAENIKVPSLVAVPKVDKIVPRTSALALASSLPKSKVVTPPSGHIGMVTSRRAKDGLWRELSDWILSF